MPGIEDVEPIDLVEEDVTIISTNDPSELEPELHEEDK